MCTEVPKHHYVWETIQSRKDCWSWFLHSQKPNEWPLQISCNKQQLLLQQHQTSSEAFTFTFMTGGDWYKCDIYLLLRWICVQNFYTCCFNAVTFTTKRNEARFVFICLLLNVMLKLMDFWGSQAFMYTVTRRPASADRTARRQFQATGQPVSRMQASDAMTSRLPRY